MITVKLYNKVVYTLGLGQLRKVVARRSISDRVSNLRTLRIGWSSTGGTQLTPTVILVFPAGLKNLTNIRKNFRSQVSGHLKTKIFLN